MATNILVIDEGTTSTRAVLFDAHSQVVHQQGYRIEVAAPSAAILEQDATQIADRTIAAFRDVLGRTDAAGIAGIGVTNQRTTTVLWDRATGHPVAPVVSWQDTRAQRYVDRLAQQWSERFTATTGLQLAPANVGLHLAMLLEDPELRRRAAAGELAAGTPDSWVIWNLTGGSRHVTSFSNAGSTGMYDLINDCWWSDWLDELGVPSGMLAEVLDDDADFGVTDGSKVGAELPIRSAFADQQAALYGHGGFDAGAVKCTHGTGSFVDFNMGQDLHIVGNGLDTRAAWRTGEQTRYLIEGASFVTGSAIDWLVDGLHLMSDSAEVDAVYARTPDSSGVIVVPALAGFTAPFWDQQARGMILGLHRGVGPDQIVKATIDGIAATTADLVLCMAKAVGTAVTSVLVDGGLSRSRALLQAQADFTGVPVRRAADAESVTARGAAWMAGVATGVWSDAEVALAEVAESTEFAPALTAAQLARARKAWTDAVQRALGWRPAESADKT